MQKKLQSERVHSAWEQTQNISFIIKISIIYILLYFLKASNDCKQFLRKNSE